MVIRTHYTDHSLNFNSLCNMLTVLIIFMEVAKTSILAEK